MTSSIDSNVLAALWDSDHPANTDAVKMLDQALKQGNLVATAPVYAELMAGPLRDEGEMDRFFSDTGISIEWKIEEDAWREAGRAYCE